MENANQKSFKSYRLYPQSSLSEQGEEIAAVQETLKELTSKVDAFKKDYDKVLTWAEIYDTCSIEGKKMIIRQLIKKISVFKDYSLKIELNLSYQQFAELISIPAESAKVSA